MEAPNEVLSYYNETCVDKIIVLIEIHVYTYHMDVHSKHCNTTFVATKVHVIL